MSVTTRQVGPCFAAEVEGIDMSKPLSPDEVKAVHAGMDTYAVLVFHDQHITDDQQLAFTRSLGDIEHAIGTSLRAPDEYRLPTTFADVSNLDQHHQVFARDDRRRLFALGNRSICPRTRAPSWAGPCRRRASSCAISSSTPPSASSSMPTRGGSATW
jgi:alpha-ketoglutarate-dependent 2,4-dichlorophenoxyacetate dioxygenase